MGSEKECLFHAMKLLKTWRNISKLSRFIDHKFTVKVLSCIWEGHIEFRFILQFSITIFILCYCNPLKI